MNEIQWLKSLRSPDPAVPAIDVSRSVMAALPLAPRPDRTATLIWSVAAALGLAATTAAGIIAITLWQSANDPLASMASAWSSVMQ